MSGGENGRVAVVTGGAHGLGSAVAKRFAQAGFKICVLDIDWAVAQELVNHLQERSYPAICAKVDVADPDSIQSALDECIQRFSQIDVLVCSAAVAPVARYLEISPAEWDCTFAVNVRGLFFCN